MQSMSKFPVLSTLVVAIFLFTSCTEGATIETKASERSESTGPKVEQSDSAHIQLVPLMDPITVMVVPCSNGYEYDMKMGDLNPSLEKYLSRHKSIKVIPFPLKKMKGTGYFGVYDKKYCSGILKQVDVDFLIMTQMKGMDLVATDSETANWGYATKILNIATMHQFNGIAAENLPSFEQIDSDIKQKVEKLVEQITQSSKTK